MYVYGRVLKSLPEWATYTGLALAGVWLIYCSMWAKAAARLMVFERKTLRKAGYPAEQEVNMQILLFMLRIPLLGSLFRKKDETEDAESQQTSEHDK